MSAKKTFDPLGNGLQNRSKRTFPWPVCGVLFDVYVNIQWVTDPLKNRASFVGLFLRSVFLVASVLCFALSGVL